LLDAGDHLPTNTVMGSSRLAEEAMRHGAMQKPEELALLIEFLQRERLTTVVEIGTASGGTLFVWCRLATPDATIVSIDLPGGPFGPWAEEPEALPVVEPFTDAQTLHRLRMDSGSERTRRELERLLGGRTIDLLFIDGDHSYYGARTDFLQYSPLVRDGGLIVFHDIIDPRQEPSVEVPYLWEQLKRAYECREIVIRQPEHRWGGFGVLEWNGSVLSPQLDPSPDGTGFGLASVSPEATISDPVVDVETVVGPLLLPRDDTVITSVLGSCGEWEPFETRYLGSTLRPGQTFVDVGAHVGYFSVLASKCVGPTGTVIAVEPEPRNLHLLRQNLTRNGCGDVQVVPFAAHSRRGWTSLALSEQNRGAHRLVPLGEAETIVRCVRLDDLLPAKVDVVKIDAQGYDHDVVAGLERTLAANPEMTVISELSRSELAHRGLDVESVLDWYVAHHFTLSLFDDSGRLNEMSADAALGTCRARNWADLSVVLRTPSSPSLGRWKPDERPRRADGLEVNEVLDGLIVVQPAEDHVHYLNHTAAVVFDLCTGQHEVSEIAELVQAIYELPEPPEAEVEDCLRGLGRQGLVTPEQLVDG
jgi:FkbM family methyltransferase